MSRLAVVEKEKCSPVGCGEWCIKKCPVNRKGEKCIALEKEKAVIDEQLCIGCGICIRCPFDAVHIINLPEKLEEPLHRFGKSTFELFNLPLLKKNSVVGIIGRNGIGKSTSLAILSGEIIPNFGEYEKETDKLRVIEKYSNTILGEYFKNLYGENIKVALKPQRVEMMAKAFNGKAIELLKKVDEKNKIKEYLKLLELEDIKKRELNELSGGELQRIAILATALKKADVYYFDEPTSFCDIEQRIKVAKLIRELSKEASVIVVEHDLATLDYISDEIQIVYGEASCYGVFSQSKAVRRGINEYLDGFLPEDNIRFRNYSIRFLDKGVIREVSNEALLEYPDLKKNFEDFSLMVDGGKVRKGELLAIMGQNGLGKTTFVKMLAGELVPDKGKVETLKVSYKPQYLDQNSNKTVQEVLLSSGDVSSGWVKSMFEKLGLNKIMMNKVKNLSGGELQKLYIASTLIKDADIIIMDEPSAFIDVEDRLSTAEIIKDFVIRKEICAIIVDHDIQFIDYLADSILIFEGKPGKKGNVIGPLNKKDGMNRVLKNLDITYRRDRETLRPRINKPGSQLDVEQRKEGNYYLN